MIIMVVKLMIILATIGCNICIVYCDWNHDMRLHDDLMANYSVTNRPHNKTDVISSLAINQLLEMDERKQTLLITVWFRFYWTDIRLTWNPDAYGGMTETYLSVDEIWLPDITLYNNANDKRSSIKQYSEDILVRVDHTGDIRWLVPGIIKTSCQIDMMLFPFDTQRCPIQYGSWTLNGNQLDLLTQDDQGDFGVFLQHGEWDLLEFPAKRNVLIYNCCPEPYVDLSYTMVLKRKPLFYIYNLIIPCGLLLIVSIMGFLMPIASGARAPLSIMVLLSMTVLQLNVSSTIPIQSENTPLISQYIGYILLMMSLNVILTIGSLNIHYRGHYGNRMSQTTRKVMLGVLGRLVCKTIPISKADMKHKETNVVIANDGTMGNSRNIENLKLCGNKGNEIPNVVHMDDNIEITDKNQYALSNINKLLIFGHQNKIEKVKHQDEQRKIREEWMMVAMVTDRLFALFFFFISFVTFLSIFLQLV
ncbi:unnamed protein product [Owenia fusiformis]|uniref:Uncharacterized protein n=1 Tax=Owenia fusiformis TaxID=6347 RepID=A0A8J1XE60_OWEFU|nr:unnamed protein product [Owenia fusiformis]